MNLFLAGCIYCKIKLLVFLFSLFCLFGVDMKNCQTGLILLKMHQCGLARQRTFAAKNGEPRTNGLSNWTRLGCWPLITPSMNQDKRKKTTIPASKSRVNKTEHAVQSYAAENEFFNQNAIKCYATLSCAEQCWVVLSNTEKCWEKVSISKVKTMPK